MDPLRHFSSFGAAEGRAPHPGFHASCLSSPAPANEGGLHPALRYLIEAPTAPARTPRAPGQPRRILLDTPRGVHLGENLGDVAMCASALLRFAEREPEGVISVVVDDPRVLAFTGVPIQPVSSRARGQWLRDPEDAAAVPFAAILSQADIVASTGHGAGGDAIADDSIASLRVLGAAMRHGATTAILGHGLGPLGDPRLRAVAAQVLPRVDLLCVRDHGHSPAVLRRIGVARHRIVVTGDDATRICSAAGEQGAPGGSNDLGLSVRVGHGVEWDAALQIAALAGRVASGKSCRIVPLPIDHSDVSTLGRLGHSCRLPMNPVSSLAAVAGCRAVLAGSYQPPGGAMTRWEKRLHTSWTFPRSGCPSVFRSTS